jgi:hypothetical protein
MEVSTGDGAFMPGYFNPAPVDILVLSVFGVLIAAC